MDVIGRLESLWRYPVKSMMGEELAESTVTYAGLPGDRVWAFVMPGKRPSFPWYSAREQHDLILYKPRFIDPPKTDQPFPDAKCFAIDVTTPDGAKLAIDNPSLLTELRQRAGAEVQLRFSEKGMHDARPISIFGSSTIAKLADETGVKVDGRRFRANFYVKWRDEAPFFEDSLVGQTLKLGEKVELLVVKKDPRCKIITLDPDTAQTHPEVLQTVATQHAGCAGVYAVVVKEGLVRRGDLITRA